MKIHCIKKKLDSILWYSEYSNLLLFEIPSVLLVDENKIEIVSDAKFLINVAEGRCQVETTKE